MTDARIDAHPEPETGSTVLGVVAVGSAIAAGGALAVADVVAAGPVETEALVAFAWIAGWVLVVWSVTLGVAHAIGVARRLATRVSVPGAEIVILAATAVVLAVVVAAHPLWGTGSGVG